MNVSQATPFNASNQNRRGIPIALCLILAAAIPCAVVDAKLKYESTPISSAIVLDGDPIDWKGISIAYLKDDLHVVSIAHDDQHLYVMYRFADEQLARRLMSRGVTFWINGDGKNSKKDEQFGVRYAGSEQISKYLEMKNPQGGFSPPDDADRFGRRNPPPELDSLRQVPGQLTVIREGLKDTVGEDEDEGPWAASNIHDGGFCYELRVPFAEMGGKITKTEPSKTRKIAIGIQIGGLTKAESDLVQSVMGSKGGGFSAMGGRGGMGGGRGGGMGGGGMDGGHGGGKGGGQGGGQNPLKSKIKWLSLTLP